MKKGTEIVKDIDGLTIIYQKISGKELGDHQHIQHEFIFPMTGVLNIKSAEKTLSVRPGEMVYIPAQLKHSFASSKNDSGERVIWLVSEKLWSQRVSEKFQLTTFPKNSFVNEMLFFILIKKDIPGQEYFVRALIESLKDSLESAKMNLDTKEIASIKRNIKDERILKALTLLDLQFRSVSIPEVAKECGMSLRNFNRLFFIETGLSPLEYCQIKKINLAKLLLRKSQKTVTDISLELGYSSLSKFIEAFKKNEGLLPGDYRANKSKMN